MGAVFACRLKLFFLVESEIACDFQHLVVAEVGVIENAFEKLAALRRMHGSLVWRDILVLVVQRSVAVGSQGRMNGKTAEVQTDNDVRF